MVIKISLISLVFFCYSCIYKGLINSYGVPITKFKKIKCNKNISEKYEGSYEQKYYFSGVNNKGNYKDLVNIANTPNFTNKTSYLQIWNTCEIRLFINRNIDEKHFSSESGLMGYIGTNKNKDYIIFYTIINGEGRSIKRNIEKKGDSLIISEVGSNTNGYIYIKI